MNKLKQIFVCIIPEICTLSCGCFPYVETYLIHFTRSKITLGSCERESRRAWYETYHKISDVLNRSLCVKNDQYGNGAAVWYCN